MCYSRIDSIITKLLNFIVIIIGVYVWSRRMNLDRVDLVKVEMERHQVAASAALSAIIDISHVQCPLPNKYVSLIVLLPI